MNTKLSFKSVGIISIFFLQSVISAGQPLKWNYSFNSVNVDNYKRRHNATSVVYGAEGWIYLTGFINLGVSDSFNTQIHTEKWDNNGNKISSVTYQGLSDNSL